MILHSNKWVRAGRAGGQPQDQRAEGARISSLHVDAKSERQQDVTCSTVFVKSCANMSLFEW